MGVGATDKARRPFRPPTKKKEPLQPSVSSSDANRLPKKNTKQTSQEEQFTHQPMVKKSLKGQRARVPGQSATNQRRPKRTLTGITNVDTFNDDNLDDSDSDVLEVSTSIPTSKKGHKDSSPIDLSSDSENTQELDCARRTTFASTTDNQPLKLKAFLCEPSKSSQNSDDIRKQTGTNKPDPTAEKSSIQVHTPKHHKSKVVEGLDDLDCLSTQNPSRTSVVKSSPASSKSTPTSKKGGEICKFPLIKPSFDIENALGNSYKNRTKGKAKAARNNLLFDEFGASAQIFRNRGGTTFKSAKKKEEERKALQSKAEANTNTHMKEVKGFVNPLESHELNTPIKDYNERKQREAEEEREAYRKEKEFRNVLVDFSQHEVLKEAVRVYEEVSSSAVSSQERKRKQGFEELSYNTRRKSPKLGHECPACGKEVDLDLYNSFLKDGSIKPSDEDIMHRSHILNDANKYWNELGIPQIDWLVLENRIRKNFAYLQGIMKGTRESHYRQAYLDSSAKKSRKTKIRQDFESEWEQALPGYYGPRGTEVMTRLIMQSTDIKSLLHSKIDGVSIGVGDYCTLILIPELATKLIMEDMKLPDINEARDLMMTTANLGEVLHKEVPHEDTKEGDTKSQHETIIETHSLLSSEDEGEEDCDDGLGGDLSSEDEFEDLESQFFG